MVPSGRTYRVAKSARAAASASRNRSASASSPSSSATSTISPAVWQNQALATRSPAVRPAAALSGGAAGSSQSPRWNGSSQWPGGSQWARIVSSHRRMLGYCASSRPRSP